ncbi:MAG: hypothetical protein VW032_05745, partial [Pontimonas sp.]
MRSHDSLAASMQDWANQDPEEGYRNSTLALIEELLGGDESAANRANELFGSRLAFGTAGI